MKKTINRRTFLKNASATSLATGVALRTGAGFAQGSDLPAETIFIGGTILTMDDAMPKVEAVAIAAGRIIAAGDKETVLGLTAKDTQIVDLKGGTLMPSFIDAHGHFVNAIQLAGWANVSGKPAGPVETTADILTVLKEHAAKVKPAPGDWIIGYGYDPTGLPPGQETTKFDLDAVFPDNPVLLIHVSNHGALLNSAAMKLAGIDASTPTPPGGVILRVAGSNEPSGLLMETAFLPVFTAMPQPTKEDLLGSFGAGQMVYAQVGVTTCQDGATNPKDYALFREAAGKGLLYLDIVSLPFLLDVPVLVAEYFPTFQGGPMKLPDVIADKIGTYQDRLKVGGVKLVLDGSPQGKTAFWSEPLLTPGPEGEADWRGAPIVPPEVVTASVAELRAKNVPMFIHCNGDAAIDMAIDAVRAAGATAADDHRTVIIHSQCMRPDQIDTYAELGLSPSFFTAHTFFWGDVHLENLGETRAFFISPTAAAKAKGLKFSNHNDFSVTPMDPMRMVWSAVKRQTRSGLVLGPDQRIDAASALKALTTDAAWQIREEDSKGRIAEGMRADLVILSADPTAVEADTILDIVALETFKDGVSVYKRAV